MKRSISEKCVNANSISNPINNCQFSKSMDSIYELENLTINNSDIQESENSNSPNSPNSSNNQESSIIYKEITRADIEKIIGMKPIDLTKYKKAFVHKSVVKNAKESDKLPTYMQESYERFEFLGDSVLSLIVAKYIFKRFPNSQEGILTKIRTKLVNGKTLAMFANKLNLSQYLILNYKVENINGRNNNRILEDVFESLICSIYLDLGFDFAEKFILGLIEKHINFDELLIDNNFKDILLRFCQNKFACTPTYDIIETLGPPHNRTFKVMCYIQSKKYRYGVAKSKKEAEQIAAKQTLLYFQVPIE